VQKTAVGGEMPLVSVIIPTYNRAHFLKTAIESVQNAGARDLDYEIIVIDDGSTDNTREILKNYSVKILSSSRQGPCAARNAGIKEARGEFIAFLDDDDVWCQNYPRKQVDFLCKNPQYGAVLSQMMVVDEHLNPRFGPFPNKEIQSGWMFKSLFNYVPPTSSIFVRRSILDETGLFSTEIDAGEDWDLMFRISQKFQVGYIPEIGILYRSHRKPQQNDVEKEGRKIYERCKVTASVFKKYAKYLGIKDKLIVQKAYWKHKGFYIPGIMNLVLNSYKEKKYSAALRLLTYSIRLSPIHTIVQLLKAPSAFGKDAQ